MANQKFITEVHRRSRPLAVDSMNDAVAVLTKQIERGPAPGTAPDVWARHLAWVIGFDTLIDDRKRLRDLSEHMVEAG